MSKNKRRPATLNRRPLRSERWYQRVPLMPVIVGGLLAVAAIAAIAYAVANPSPAGAGGTIDGIKCESNEQVATHYHAHLAIYVNGTPALLPAGVGIDDSTQCLYWLHTHDTGGVIHIEAPKNQKNHQFTLRNFFDVWHKPISKTQIGDAKVGPGQQLLVTVDGKPYTGDPGAIVLKAHEQIVIQITPPEVTPTPYTFKAGE